MPTNLAARPFGRVASSELSSCSPSPRVSLRVKGLEAPATALSGPAVTRAGANGRVAGLSGQAAPFGPWETLKIAVGCASGVPSVDQGTRSEVVSKPPQVT